MRTLKKAICLILLVLTTVFLFTACAKPPDDGIEANIVSVSKTYKRDSNQTEIFFLFDLLNGKERNIASIEIDVEINFTDGTKEKQTIRYDDEIVYSISSPLTIIYTVDGRSDSLTILEWRFELKSYWDTFGSLIISSILTAIVIAIILIALAAADMGEWVAMGAGAVVLFCIGFTIMAPFCQSIYIIIGTAIVLVGYLIAKNMDY